MKLKTLIASKETSEDNSNRMNLEMLKYWICFQYHTHTRKNANQISKRPSFRFDEIIVFTATKNQLEKMLKTVEELDSLIDVVRFTVVEFNGNEFRIREFRFSHKI